MPCHRVKHVAGIIDGHPGIAGQTVREFFTDSDELLIGRIPIDPRIGRDLDLGLEGQIHPVEGLGHGQALQGDHLGPFQALRPGQTGIWIGDHAIVACPALRHGIVDRVRPCQRIPRLHQDARLGDAGRAAFLSFKAESLAPNL